MRTELRDRIAESLRKLKVGATRSARLSEAGENEVLNYMRGIQAESRGNIVFTDTAVAQGMGWPVEDVQIVLKHLKEKGWIDYLSGGGYLLRST